MSSSSIDEYLPDPKCSSIKLPINHRFIFPTSFLNDIKIFSNRSNPRAERISSQMKVEKQLVEAGKCSQLNPQIMNDFKLRLFNMDPNKIDNEVSTNLDAKLHDYIACYVDAIINTKSDPFSISDNVYNWFVDEQLIGANSVEGYAFQTSTTPESKLFVIKSPRNIRRDELVHEALIGRYAMNKLRHYLPNYMYVYGYFGCSSAIINGKEIISWCSEPNPKYSYLVTENIRDAVPIKEFIVDQTINENDLMAVLYQVENALNLAYKQYGYTHYDLHHSNIMVRKYKKLVAIPYFGTRGQIIGYIVTKYVPYIIDYGYSRITIGNVGFGKIGLEHAGIEGERPFPMYDIYKLICFLGETIYTSPKGINYTKFTQILETLFSFFGDGTLNKRVIKRLSTEQDFYNLSETYRPITHDHYIDWLHKSGLPIPIITNMNELYQANIYPAPINTDLDTCTFYDKISSDNGPNTSLEYCEIISALNSDTTMSPEIKQSAINWVNSNFDAADYFEYSLPILKNKLRSTFEYYNTVKDTKNNIIPNIGTISEITLADPFYIESYRKIIISYFRIKQLIRELDIAIRSGICSLTLQNSLVKYNDSIQKLQNDVDIFADILESQNSILENNIKYAANKNWKKYSRQAVAFWMDEHPSYLPQ